MGGSIALPDSAWWQLQLPVEKPWSMMGGHLFAFLHKQVQKMLLSPCRDFISGNLGSF